GSNRCAFTTNWGGGIVFSLYLDLDLPGHLLQIEDHELGRLEWREADHDVNDPQVAVVLGGGIFVTLDKVGVAWCLSLECTLAEQVVHECPDVEPDLRPEWLVVGLEDNPLQPAVQAFLDEER